MTDKGQPFDNLAPSFGKRRTLLFGNDSDSLIKAFFGSQAMVAIVILVLITIFLFKEGIGFFGQYRESIREYRFSGLEYVDIIKGKREGHVKLTRYLNDVKARWIEALKGQGLSQEEISEVVSNSGLDKLFRDYLHANADLEIFIKEKMSTAISFRDQYLTYLELKKTLSRLAEKIKLVEDPDYLLTSEDRTKLTGLLKIKSRVENLDRIQNKTMLSDIDREIYLDFLRDEHNAFAASIETIDPGQSIQQIIGDRDRYFEILDEFAMSIGKLLEQVDHIDLSSAVVEERLNTFKSLNYNYIKQIPNHKETLEKWDHNKPVSIWRSLGSFLFGKKWITASDQQDWYGLLPLLTGSLLISAIALFLAVPFGVGAAIYVNQIAKPAEQNVIKPYIEFISAIPSVVIGFFGIIVFGDTVRQLSQAEFLQWVPFFPIQERLNAFTAGCLLALMAVPTIFTLAEDAINNIPGTFTEASLAMGASKLQTTFRVIVPSALSGIISAVMLGFGRVIGETMVVLLCAGNRIKVPDFTQGLGIFFEPVHTMTGIIAQEMGEVVNGSLHYRALFMVGIALFFISLLVNYSAQWVVKKYNRLGY